MAQRLLTGTASGACGMNKQIKFFGFKSLLIAAICFLAFTGAFASTTKEKINSLVVENLSKKLKNDLAVEKVTVELKNVTENKISANEIALNGTANCVLIADEMPISFEAKINLANQTVSDIVYDFVEPKTEFEPTTGEEVLVKELMKQISKDYKTNNIVIAIDGTENLSASADEKQIAGVGEVRIGDLVWNKIKFVVVLDEEKRTAKQVVYKVEK